MTILIIGLAVLFGIHSVPMRPTWRARVVGKLGEGPYKAVFSLVALAGLAVAVTGMARAPHIDIWRPPAWASTATAVALLPAFILLAAANLRCRIKRAARHPMSLGLLLWALAHLLANGDLASLILFGGFAAFALLDIARPRAPQPPPATDAATAKRDALAVGIGVAAYLALAALHRPLFGVAAFNF